MEVRLLDKNKEKTKVSFILKNSVPSFANAIRRTIMDEVPTLAVEDVEFRKNSSILYDEMIAHRLGLIPLNTDLKSYDLPEKCTCKGEGCAKCQLKMVLKAKGPTTVYASDLKINDPKIKPIYPQMPIVKLIKNQQVELEATAVLGQGRNHAKWSPGLVHYKYKPAIEVGKVDNANEVAAVCPLNIFEVKGGKLIVNKEKMLSCHLCGACHEKNPQVKINESETEFVFFIESWGQLNYKEMLTEAVKLFQSHLNEFIDIMKKK